jgi:rsbT co-antagonist protein RsbR
MRFLIEHCPLGLSQHRTSGEFVAASPSCAALFGYAVKDLLGRDLFALMQDADQGLVRTQWAQVTAVTPEHKLRFTCVRPDGSSVLLEATLRHVAAAADPDPAVGAADPPEPHILCCLRDITQEVEKERTRAARLAEAELAERHRDILVGMMPGLVWFGPVSPDLKTYRATYMSEYLFRVTGYTAKQWLETPGFYRSVIHPEDRDHILAAAPKAMAEERPLGPYRILAHDGRVLWIRSQMKVERDAAGVPVRMYGLTLDMTAFQQAQQERMRLQEEVARQAQHLLDLSTPLIPVSEDVLVMPVIGTLDPARAQHALETVLAGVSAARARYVLVDLTGVSSVDTAAAMALLRMVHSVALLGARVVLTGMRSETAREVTMLGIDLKGVMTQPTLRAAVSKYVAARQQAARSRSPQPTPGPSPPGRRDPQR